MHASACFGKPFFWTDFPPPFWAVVAAKCPQSVPNGPKTITCWSLFRWFCRSPSQKRKHCFDCAGVYGLHMRSSGRAPISHFFRYFFPGWSQTPFREPIFSFVAGLGAKMLQKGLPKRGPRTTFSHPFLGLGPVDAPRPPADPQDALGITFFMIWGRCWTTF